MIRVALVGDSHCDEHNRFDEHNRIMEWTVRDAAARGCSLFLHSGDVWERKSSPLERLAVADWVQLGSEFFDQVIVCGNHDTPEDIEWIGRLRPRHRLKAIHAVTRPMTILVGGAVVVHCLPWPRKAYLAAGADASVTHGQSDGAARQALTNVLRGFATGAAASATARHPSIVLAHCMVRGSRVSSAQPPLVGMDFELSLEDLALARADYYALGHIHLCQEWSIGSVIAGVAVNDSMPMVAGGRVSHQVGIELSGRGAPVVYPGGPRRVTYGEMEPKGYVVITFGDDGKLVRWERVPTPCTPMLHISGAFADGVLETDEPEDIQGAEIRLRYTVAPDLREQARATAQGARARMLAVGGAVAVKVEEQVEVEARARAPEVASAVTLKQKLEAHWAAKGFDPGPRREALLTKLAQLEDN